MKKLTVLGYDYDAFRRTVNITELKKMLPNLRINRRTIDMNIASPDWDHYVFWEINAEPEELFRDFNSEHEEIKNQFFILFFVIVIFIVTVITISAMFTF